MGIATPTVTKAPRQLSDGNSQGTILGRQFDVTGLPDTISFYGGTPIAQPSGPAQAAVSNDAQIGEIVVYQLTWSPSAVAANTTAEQTVTVAGVTAGSLIIVNKPTAQAGLGIAGARASAANQIGVTFTNDTANSITPTATQVYQVVEIKAATGLLFSSALSPAAVAANATVEQQFTAPTGDLPAGTVLAVNKPAAQAGLGIAGARVVSANIVGITFINNTAASITPTAAESYLFFASSGLGAASQIVTFGINVGTVAAILENTTQEVDFTLTGLLATDVILSVQKPTLQAGLGIAGAYVEAANTLGVNYINATGSSITPTANEIYIVTVLRLAPVQPLVVYTPALTPVAVAANTTAEQTFTVTGLVASSQVLVNKPSVQAGLSIVGARVSAANTLALTYQNDTAASITPAAETYTVGNFQAVGPGGGAATYTPSVTETAGAGNSIVTLLNALRSALVALNLIAGQ